MQVENGNLVAAFEVFWASYPKKRSKGDARKAWAKLRPNQDLQDRIMESLERIKVTEDWQREGGRYIPYPATWLNAEGWEDEPTVTVEARADEFRRRHL